MNVPFMSLKFVQDEIEQEIMDAFKNAYHNTTYIYPGEDSFCKDFAEYIGVKASAGVGNGLDALTLILRSYDIGAGDEVIVPSNTFIATALAVSSCGATPVFVEPKIETYNLDSGAIEAAITDKTKAIMPVHLYGQPCEMDEINAVAKKHGLKVIEDACQAHGAKYKGKRAGALGDAAAFSFYPGKNLGGLGDGGIAVSNDVELINRVKWTGDYGGDKKYHHVIKGVNSRLDVIQDAFLKVKLPHLDRQNARRREIAKMYMDGITNPDVTLPKVIDDVEVVWHLFPIRIQKRDELQQHLDDNGIEARVNYPVPIHLQGAYKDSGYEKESLPIAEEISRTELSLPMFYGLADEQVGYVIDRINNFR